MRNTFAIAAIAALVALAPAAALAGTECQSAPAVGMGGDPASAWQNWQDNVANAYSPAWAKLELAQNKGVSPLTIPGLFGPDVTSYTAVGTPCRTVRLKASLATNVGNLEVMQSNEAPVAPRVFKKQKLAIFK